MQEMSAGHVEFVPIGNELGGISTESMARATDGDRVVQPEERTAPFPSGATGWHRIVVRCEPA